MILNLFAFAIEIYFCLSVFVGLVLSTTKDCREAMQVSKNLLSRFLVLSWSSDNRICVLKNLSLKKVVFPEAWIPQNMIASIGCLFLTDFATDESKAFEWQRF